MRHLGVVIGRFQTHKLTDGHRHVLSQVATRASSVLVLVGCAPVIGTKRNPLEFLERYRMLTDYWLEAFQGGGPELTVLPCLDCPTNEEWARRIDQMVSAVATTGSVTVFGSHDSCCSIYSAAGGRWPTEDIDPMGSHASKLRAGIVPRYTEDFRAGVIYGIERRFVNPFPCVDIAVFKGGDVLLVQKVTDGAHWRLPGGFVDPRDPSMEIAAKREFSEETGVECSFPSYAGSRVILDWRYRGGPESIMSAVFTADYVFGAPKAADDVAKAEWVDFNEAFLRIHPNHAELLSAVREKRMVHEPSLP